MLPPRPAQNKSGNAHSVEQDRVHRYCRVDISGSPIRDTLVDTGVQPGRVRSVQASTITG